MSVVQTEKNYHTEERYCGVLNSLWMTRTFRDIWFEEVLVHDFDSRIKTLLLLFYSSFNCNWLESASSNRNYLLQDARGRGSCRQLDLVDTKRARGRADPWYSSTGFPIKGKYRSSAQRDAQLVRPYVNQHIQWTNAMSKIIWSDAAGNKYNPTIR